MALTKQATSGKYQHSSTSAESRFGLALSSLILGVLSFAGMMMSIWMIFLYAPTDAIQGQPQRIFYFHVPMAWIGMLGFIVLTIAGIVYLCSRDERWDWVARASAEVGAVFLTLALTLGSIWGKTTWGTWWTWDPKLTTALILWFIYIGYNMLRSYTGRTESGARAAAVFAIVGVIDVPIIYEATNWWRTLHPAAQVGVAGALPNAVVATLLVSLTTFTLLYSFLMVQLYQLQKLQTHIQRRREQGL
ncbi:MAG: cytochrome c biogenesis protein CcsA [Ktedonobacteraceae bacterium]|nr:cytochrome c biogenesis protein CcsA [Ktedonobacteraceae bacterium]